MASTTHQPAAALRPSRPSRRLRQLLQSCATRYPSDEYQPPSLVSGESPSAGVRSSGLGREGPEAREFAIALPVLARSEYPFLQYFCPDGKALAVLGLSPWGLSSLWQCSGQLDLNFSSQKTSSAQTWQWIKIHIQSKQAKTKSIGKI